jgi:aspartate-semialdehyde dehydrogenase
MSHSKKIPVGVLGATGSVGQKFIELLSRHPWFTIREVAASDKSAGQRYGDRVNWFSSAPLPEAVANLTIKPCIPDLTSPVIFSGLDAAVAGPIEKEFAMKGFKVISNAKNHRMDPDVPLLIPEVNPEHLKMIESQKYGNGCIVTNPNCSTIGLVLALKPLLDNFGLEQVNVVTLQALSGAGYPGVPGIDILDNVIPYIAGEEPKIEAEPLKIFGKMVSNKIKNYDLKISAQCNRVAVQDGHLECIQVKLSREASEIELKQTWKSFQGEPQHLKLPSAPLHPVYYLKEERYPQPKLHRHMDKGMAVSVGRLRTDPFFDYKFIALSHNTVRGAAGGAILCAELMKSRGYL